MEQERCIFRKLNDAEREKMHGTFMFSYHGILVYPLLVDGGNFYAYTHV
jgi:hypothetical protein